MTLVVLLSVYPLYYAVVNSLNDGTNTTNFGMVQLWPRQFSLDSWRMVVKDPAIPTALGITASRTVIVTVCQLIFTSMFAYAFSIPLEQRQNQHQERQTDVLQVEPEVQVAERKFTV